MTKEELRHFVETAPSGSGILIKGSAPWDLITYAQIARTTTKKRKVITQRCPLGMYLWVVDFPKEEKQNEPKHTNTSHDHTDVPSTGEDHAGS